MTCLLFQQERCLYVNTSSRTKSNPGHPYIRQRPQTTLQLMPSDLIRAGIFETASGIYRHDQMTRNLIRSIRSDFLQNFEIKARPLDTNQFSSRIPSSLSHIIHHILQHEGECRPQLVLGYLWLMFCSIMDRFWPSSTKAEKPPSRSPVSLAPLKTRFVTVAFANHT